MTESTGTHIVQLCARIGTGSTYRVLYGDGS